MRSLRSILALAAALLLGACASSPETHLYVLSSVPGTAAAASDAAGAQRIITVGPVSLPDYLDQPGIVTRGGPNRVFVATFHQWAGALPTMATRVLVQDMATRLPGDRVAAFDAQSPRRPDLRVLVQFGQFDVDDAGHAVASAHWEIYGTTGTAPLSARDTVARFQAAGSSYDDRVAALSQALGELADQIVAAIGSAQTPGDGSEAVP